VIQKRLDEAALDKMIEQDLADITKAFEENDEEALRRIFNKPS